MSEVLSTETKFTPGHIVYARDGRKATYIGKVDGGHVIEYQLIAYRWYGDSEEEEIVEGNIEVVDVVYSKAPLAVLEAEFASLNKRIEKSRETLQDLERKTSNALRDYAASLNRLKAFDALRNIEDFIDGKITHFVVCRDHGNISAEAAETFLSSDDRYEKERKLLSLFGSSKGDLLWKVNHYKDGSGAWFDVVPCTSEDEAKAIAKSRFESYLETVDIERLYYFDRILTTAAALGVVVPARVLDRGYANKVASLTHALTSKEKEAAALRIDLQKIVKARGGSSNEGE